MKISLRPLVLCLALVAAPAFAGSVVETSSPEPTESQAAFPFEFEGEFGYVGDARVERGREPNRRVVDYDEIYAAARFVYTPRIAVGILRLGVAYERFGFGMEDNVQLPETLQSLRAVIGLDTKFSDSFLVRFEAQPGFFGTDDSFYEGTFHAPFIFGGSYIYSSDLQFIIGVSVDYERQYPILPGVGVRWHFGPQWTLNAVVPKPRLEYELNKNVMFYAGADLRGAAFRTDDSFGDRQAGDSQLNHAVMVYTELRTGAGVDVKLAPGVRLSFEGGYVPYREFHYYRTDVRYHHESGAPYGAASLRADF
jgi:hypothetical protein